MTIHANRAAMPSLVQIPTFSIAELDHDPHGIFRRCRPHTPFIRRPDNSYIAIRAADVARLITDPRTRQMETELLAMRGITSGPLFDVMAHSMLFANGTEHRRRRAPMSRSFAFRVIEALRPGIRAAAEALIDGVAEKGEMNLVDDYAALMPARTISAILGLPEADIPRFTAWVYSISRVLSFSFTPEDVPETTDAAAQLLAYAEKLLADRRATPRDDFLTAFARAVDEDGSLSPVETLSQIVTLMVAGSDTTRAALAIQVALLLDRRRNWEDVCRDPALVPGAVSEALRYEPAVGSVPRFTLADIEIDGAVVPAGRLLTLSTLAAMRDPALYFEPDYFDIRRTDHPRWHMVFGGGEHRCLGEALARTELEEGLAALTTRLPRLQMAGESVRLVGHSGIRRLSSARVVWPR